jgi:hypothetical protein
VSDVLHMQELGWREIKDRYVRPSYLPLSFTLGALTIGLRLGAANYTFTDSVSELHAAGTQGVGWTTNRRHLHRCQLDHQYASLALVPAGSSSNSHSLVGAEGHAACSPLLTF